MTYKAVIFDFGRVLIDWNPRAIYTDDDFVSDGDFKEFLDFIMPFQLCTDAGLAFENIFPFVAQRFPQKKYLVEKWQNNFELSIQEPLWETVEILKEIKSKTDLKLFGLTNFAEKLCHQTMARYDFFGTFDDVVISGAEGLVKPFEAIYHILPKRHKLRMNECIFIDDNAANIHMANQLGIYGILFEDAQKLRAELACLNIL
ncbi:MAG: HAD-IA family hydrolase [Alphaproteobacteria bacterium]